MPNGNKDRSRIPVEVFDDARSEMCPLCQACPQSEPHPMGYLICSGCDSLWRPKCFQCRSTMIELHAKDGELSCLMCGTRWALRSRRDIYAELRSELGGVMALQEKTKIGRPSAQEMIVTMLKDGRVCSTSAIAQTLGMRPETIEQRCWNLVDAKLITQSATKVQGRTVLSWQICSETRLKTT